MGEDGPDVSGADSQSSALSEYGYGTLRCYACEANRLTPLDMHGVPKLPEGWATDGELFACGAHAAELLV